MWTTGEITFLILFAGALVYLAYRIGIGLWRARGTRIVTCPENQQTVAVEVDPWKSVEDALSGQRSWRLNDCTRWPEKAGCGQMCVSQIEKAPQGCLLSSMIKAWYHEKHCCLCGTEFGEIHWHDNKPGLRSPEGELLDWTDIHPEQIPEIQKTHEPVCWDCLVAEEFRRKFPELVTDRDFPEHDTPGIWKGQA